MVFYLASLASNFSTAANIIAEMGHHVESGTKGAKDLITLGFWPSPAQLLA